MTPVLFFLLVAPIPLPKEPWNEDGNDVLSAPEENDELLVEFPEVIVEAPHIDIFGFEAVRSETTTNEEMGQREQVRFLPDAVAKTSGIALQRTGHGQASPFLRGFTGFRTLFVLDGFRFNHSAWREGPNQYLTTIDSELIDALHVRFGSGGVRYGPDAVGGTIVMETKPAEPTLPGQNHTGFAALRLASAEQSVTGHVAASGRFDGFGYRVAGTQRSFGDLQGGQDVGEQEGTGYDSAAFDAKFSFDLGEQSEIVVAHQRDRQFDVPRSHRTVDGFSWHGTTIGSERLRVLDQYRDFTYVRLDWREDCFFDRARLGLGYHSQFEQRNRIRSDGRRDRQGFDIDTIGFYLNFENETCLGKLRYGVDHYRDIVTSFRRDFAANGQLSAVRIQGPVADDATADLSGFFIEDQIDLDEKSAIIASGRYSRGEVDTDSVADPMTGNRIEVDERFAAVSAELRAERQWNDEWNTYAAFARAVRMPNLSDLTRFDSARSGEIETPSPNLDPEKFTSLEIGTRFDRGPVSVELAGYVTFIRDMIVRFPTGVVIDGDNEVQKDNAGEGSLQGIDGRVRYRREDPKTDGLWTFSWTISYAAGKIDTFLAPGVENEEPLSRVPPLRSQLSALWESTESSWWAEGLITIADDQDRLAPRDVTDTQRIPPGGTPGYTVYGIRAGFEPISNLAISMAVENLTNKDYRLHGSGVNEPGTNAVLSIRWHF